MMVFNVDKKSETLEKQWIFFIWNKSSNLDIMTEKIVKSQIDGWAFNIKIL